VTIALIGRAEGVEWTVREVLEDSRFVLVATVEDTEALLTSETSPALALVHCDLGPLGRPAELSVLAELAPEITAIALLASPGRHAVRRALSAGAHGAIAEEDVERTLTACLEAVASGLICVPADRADELTRPVLSHREKQVVWLAARGLTNFEIGTRLFLAESTVKSHLSASFRKLGVRSRSEAAALVLDPVMASDLGMTVTVDDELDLLARP
jgi:DNA-binding NarL/FixJ family response regulator